MAQLTPFDQVNFQTNTVLTVGSFDGVHHGHKALVQAVAKAAQHRQARSVIVTFDPHPREIIHPGQQGIFYLSTLKERCQALAEFGIDELVVVTFNRDFSLLSSTEFLELLYQKMGISHYVIGYDHHFGKDRAGGLQTLEAFAEAKGFSIEVVEKQQVDAESVSSTRIRKLLADNGQVSSAAKLLGRPYRLGGMVIHGKKRGRKLGYPTANIQVDHPKKVIPAVGVYAVDVRFEGAVYRAMLNIGHNPTFGEGNSSSIEVHLFDFEQDIYGRHVDVFFLERIRDEQSFASIQDLVQQLKKDEDVARSL